MINPYAPPESEPDPIPSQADDNDPWLPGLGIVIGIFTGIFLWSVWLEDWIRVGPVGTSAAKGAFYAICISLASFSDGFLRPQSWSWNSRIKATLTTAGATLTFFTAMGLIDQIWGPEGNVVLWLLLAVVLLSSRLFKSK